MLKREDVNFEKGYIDILKSKGNKDRRIYVSEELLSYLSDYEKKIRMVFPSRTYFFPCVKSTNHVSANNIQYNFKLVWKKAFPDFSGSKLPRAYDFRHHFAYYNINKWAKMGEDVNVLLPYLSRYMGHSNVNDT